MNPLISRLKKTILFQEQNETLDLKTKETILFQELNEALERVTEDDNDFTRTHSGRSPDKYWEIPPRSNAGKLISQPQKT